MKLNVSGNWRHRMPNDMHWLQKILNYIFWIDKLLVSGTTSMDLYCFRIVLLSLYASVTCHYECLVSRLWWQELLCAHLGRAVKWSGSSPQCGESGTWSGPLHGTAGRRSPCRAERSELLPASRARAAFLVEQRKGRKKSQHKLMLSTPHRLYRYVLQLFCPDGEFVGWKTFSNQYI